MKRLGKLPPVHDPRTLRLAYYLRQRELPPAPQFVDYTRPVLDATGFGMLVNDQLGCCVVAALMHLLMQQAAADGDPLPRPSSDDVIKAYSAIGGYVLGHSDTDNGCAMLDALKYAQQVGLPWRGKRIKIGAYAKVNQRDAQQVASGLWLFGGLFAGFALPQTCAGASSWGQVPTVLNGDWSPGSWGGHAVTESGLRGGISGDSYDSISWGAVYPTDSGFFQAYCDEAYVVFSERLVGEDSHCPAGFDKTELLADLAIVRG